ncbi:MAG: hypothetical protein ACR2M3_05860 [Thermomicrobiales bacterium]
MIEPGNLSWPDADLDAVRRLRVMAAAIPGTVVVETVIPVSFDAVWAVVSDLQHEVPRLEWHVRSLRITRRDGDRLEALVTGPIGIRDRFVGVLRPGWCWMQGRALFIGMAAVPGPEGTLLALAAGLRIPGAAALRPIVRHDLTSALRHLARHAE